MIKDVAKSNLSKKGHKIQNACILHLQP